MQKGSAASQRRSIMPRTLETAPVDIFAPMQSTWRISTKRLARITCPYSHVDRIDKKDGLGARYERSSDRKHLPLNRTLTFPPH
jgi:hypothetical protein